GEGRAPSTCIILVACVPCNDDFTVVGVGYWGACVGPSVSPNVGALGTATPLDPYTPMAVLGVWKDCNEDGYIGYGDQGLLEYRSELLALSSSVCPPRSTPIDPTTGRVPYDWFPSHNDGSWVRELLPIGWDRQGLSITGQPYDLNIYDINDSGARVWADDGPAGA